MKMVDGDALLLQATKLKKYLLVEPYTAKHIEYGYYADDVLAAIDHAPLIDAVPVVHGRWTHDKECSKCGELALYNGNEELVSSRYCPHCGAKMDGESKQ